MTEGQEPRRGSPTRELLVGLARAGGGAVVFSLPLQMTMEMWWLGFYIDELRLALFIGLLVPLLVGLSHFSGLRETFNLKEDTVDAFVAFAVGAVTSALCLFLLGVLRSDIAIDEILGKVALQTVPASIGALLAQSQLGGKQQAEESERRSAGYHGEVFLMAVGALFLALPVAPTAEMILVAYKIAPWRAGALAGFSIVLMHGFVYALEFKGARLRRRTRRPGASFFGSPWWATPSRSRSARMCSGPSAASRAPPSRRT